MMNSYASKVLCICICVLAFPLFLAADNYYVQWADTVDNGYYDYANSVAVDHSNNIIVAGYSDLINYWDYFTVKYVHIIADSIAVLPPDSDTLYANGIDSTRVRAMVYDNLGEKVSGMSDSITFTSHLGIFYGSVMEDSDST